VALWPCDLKLDPLDSLREPGASSSSPSQLPTRYLY
jgi:hypothetical protein